jgi:hypothetical protein
MKKGHLIEILEVINALGYEVDSCEAEYYPEDSHVSKKSGLYYTISFKARNPAPIGAALVAEALNG